MENTATNTLARMRSINEALALLKEADPETAITYNFIRKILKGGNIRYFCSGKKIILNYDDLLNVLNRG